MLPRPSSRDYKSLIWWFESKKPLLLAEMRWIQRKEDIVTLRTGREAAGFEEPMERLLGVIDRFLTTKCRCHLVKVSLLESKSTAEDADGKIGHFCDSRAATENVGQVPALLLA